MRTRAVAVPALLLLASLALVGAAPGAAPAASGSDDASFHYSYPDPISVRVAADGPVEAGRTTPLVVTLKATMRDAPGARVSFETPSGVSLPDATSFTVDLVRDQPIELRVPVKASTSGLHRLGVNVDAPATAEGGALKAFGQAFLDLPRKGPGAFHSPGLPAPATASPTQVVRASDFDHSQVRPDVGERPEPRGTGLLPLPQDAGASVQSSGSGGGGRGGKQATDGGDATIQSHSTFVVTGQWGYVDEAGVLRPQRWSTVQVWDDDPAGDSDDLLWTGQSGSDGRFTSAAINRAEECCFKGNQDVYVIFAPDTSRVRVHAEGGGAYNWYTGTTSIGTQDTHDVGSHAPSSTQYWVSRSFQYANNAFDFASNLGGFPSASLGQVKVQIPDTSACAAGGGPYYIRSTETIHLCNDNVDDKSPDDVGHEYGHFVMDRAYTDAAGTAYWPSPGGGHTWCDTNASQPTLTLAQQRGLAWSEGWADFFGTRAHNEIVNSADTSYHRPYNTVMFDMETSTYCPSTNSGDHEEYRVGHTLWDLRDNGLDSTWDTSTRTYGITNMITAIRGCNQANFQEYYDKASSTCDAVGAGAIPATDFKAIATGNTINYP